MSKKIFLLSYPRSGNTFMRYCLEHLSTYSSVGGVGVDRPILQKESKNKIIKLHGPNDVSKTEKQPLILLLRDYKEYRVTFPKNMNYFQSLENAIKNGNKPYDYFINLKYYDRYDGKKIIIYYEDLIVNFEKTMNEVLTFLGEGKDKMENFVKNFDKHKKESVAFYTKTEKSHTKGLGTHFYAKHLTLEEKNKIDSIIQEKHTKLFNLYLKRYKENG